MDNQSATPAKAKRSTSKHQPGVLARTLINRAVRAGLSRGFLDVSGDFDEQRKQIELARHCLTLAQAELGEQVMTVSDLLAWIFELIEQGMSEFHWCRITDALYCLALFLINEVPDDKELRRLCDKLYKSRHEYQQCQRFLQEQHVRERLGLDSDHLMAAAGFARSGRREHLRRIRTEKAVSPVAATH